MHFKRVMCALLIVCGTAHAKEATSIRFYNWTDYIDETVLAEFTKETGIRVEYKTFESNEELEKQIQTKRSGHDLIVTSAQFLARQKNKGIFQPIKKSSLANYAKLDPALMQKLQNSDPENNFGVPYLWGTTIFAYNKNMIESISKTAPLQSWKLLLDPVWAEKLSACGLAFIDSPSEVMPEILRYNRGIPNSLNPMDFLAAEKHLRKLAPHITYFGGDEIIDDLGNGKICAAYSYSGDLAQAQSLAAENKVGEIILVNPEEGAQIWVDLMAIPIDSTLSVPVHKLIDFLLRPEVMARISNYVAYANPVPSSWPQVNADIRTNEALFPPPSAQQKLYSLQLMTDAVYGMQDKVWRSVRKTKTKAE